MRFTKMCGAGNDFIVLNNLNGALSPTELTELAKMLCRRRFSVGADGMMVVEAPEQGGDCKMRFFNQDGSTAEMCGNGARCICRYCHDNGLAGEVQRIETTAGLVTGWRIARDQYRIRLNSPSVIRMEVRAEGVVCAYLELGSPGIPHAVVLTDLTKPREVLRDLAQRLRWSSEFPRGANVNLCALTGENEVRLLTFERGVEDFTLACGTGTGATVAALTLQGKLSGKGTRVLSDGGVLTVDVDGDELFLTGDATVAYEGCLP